MKAIYLLLHLFTISFPLIRSFENRIQYAKKWIALFPAIFLTGTFFIIWDVIFTQNGVWGFNENYLIGYSILNLPVEEWMFFITVPFASVFIYECVKFFLPKIRNSSLLKTTTIALGLSLILTATYHSDKSYTFWNFCFAGMFLAILAMSNPSWLGKFWIAYFIHLIPFIAVNGVLTGSLIDNPIVWYNDEQNLGIRFITIPVEDTVYALLLLLMNITFYEYFLKHFVKTNRKNYG